MTKGDLEIIAVAQIAEALAVTTYSNIVDLAPFFKRMDADEQRYLRAARQEEMSHYLLAKSITGHFSSVRDFYYPPRMFSDAQTTLNVLVAIEEVLIAAYLVGVRDFTLPDLCVTAARIIGIHSSHRTLARVVARGVAVRDGGPIEKVTGIQGHAESVKPPNNNGYERTLRWTKISEAIEAVTPFTDKGAAASSEFDAATPYRFAPFRPKLPESLGDFHSFIG